MPSANAMPSGSGRKSSRANADALISGPDRGTFPAVRAGHRSASLTQGRGAHRAATARETDIGRSEEHTSELQSLMRISYAVFCLKTKKRRDTHTSHNIRRQTKQPV